MSRRSLGALLSLIATLGLINLSSALYTASDQYSRSMRLQGLTHLVGLGLFIVLSQQPRLRLRRAARPALALGVLSLLFVFISGHVAGGARSWITLGPLRVQPSELLKLIVPLALANEAARPLHLRRPAHWGRAALTLTVPVALLLAQPDMGAAALLLISGLTLLWLSGLPPLLPLGLAGVGLVSAPLVWTSLHAYQRRRVLSFLHPESDPSGAGYQLLQSHASLAHGGLFGQGFRLGTQGRLGFLPEHETDFIFAHLVEEWGLLGGAICIGLLFVLVGAAFAIGLRQRDRFSALLACGLGLQLLFQIGVNLGGVLGLMPLTGVTLPFFSYGGSSIISTWMMGGLLGALCDARPRGLAGGTPPIVLELGLGVEG